jgi:hypothetical protein
MLVHSSLTFLGLVAFIRCVEVAVDDWEVGVRTSGLWDVYAELMPELADVLAMTSWAEESLWTNADDRLPADPLGRVEGRDGVVEVRDGHSKNLWS